MSEAITSTPSLKPIERALNLIPVGLKEAALDSPTFRASSHHFSDQISVVETWLEGYIRAASKLVAEVSAVESIVNSFIAQSAPPAQISEAVLDHDYTLLAMKRYGEGAREFWSYALRGVKKYEGTVVEPVRQFLHNDLRMFKDARKNLESTQKIFDATITRYLSQSKSKESSSLREDAFQVHESKKAYLKASMDFATLAPQLRSSLDKLIVKVFAEQWKEMRSSREANTTLFQKWGTEMERVRGWSKEMENSERAFRRELMVARKQLEEAAETKVRPSRELEDYTAFTVPYLGAGSQSQVALPSPAKLPGQTQRGEKQGWLMVKTVAGKPARTMWNRRWFYVQNGIFGWLIQGTKSSGVEESDKYGVLLCSVRPASQEERRFCFEIKTKDQSIILQAETQLELVEWIAAFEVAKRKALEDPGSVDAAASVAQGGVDPAFAISPPIAPEFAAKLADTLAHGTAEDQPGGLGLAPLEREASSTSARPSFDIRDGGQRRVMSLTRDSGNEGDSSTGFREGSRDHAARLMQKLDLHKRSTAALPTITQSPASGTGGIASLISASHNIMPVGPGAISPPASGTSSDAFRRNFTMPASTLAPSTLANPPAPTSLSNTAVVVSGERGVGIGGERGVPSGITANLWGSTNWGFINRLGEETKKRPVSRSSSPAPPATSTTRDDSIIMDGESGEAQALATSPDGTKSEANLPSSGVKHRKTASLQAQSVSNLSLESPTLARASTGIEDEYPSNYPLPLRAQQAQFRVLFPAVSRMEKVVLVFRATWNPNEQQEFPGRVYVTTKEVYFYSNHIGLVLITGVSLASIKDITAAPGRDCDFVYLHLKERYVVAGLPSSDEEGERRRITVKTFLEPLRLLQRRLSYLVRNANADQPDGLENVIKRLLSMENERLERSSSVESWEDVVFSPIDDMRDSPDQLRRGRNLKAPLHVDGTLGFEERAKTGREVQKFKLPNQPVVYTPKGMEASMTREFSVSAKALFHVVFGDKSAVFQLLYANRWADSIAQTPWVLQSPMGDKEQGNGHWTRQLTSPQAPDGESSFQDIQTIEILNDHLLYVVTNVKRPWRLPYNTRFRLVTKLVITHVAKSRCKLAIYQHVAWQKPPAVPYIRRLIEAQAFKDLEADALDLSNVAFDQVVRLGDHSKTNHAVEIFGIIGQQTQTAQIDASKAPSIPSLAGGKGAKGAVTRTLPGMVGRDILTNLLAVVSIGIDVIIAIGKSVLNLCTAHTFMVALLGMSLLYNSWYGYRDGLVWWQERRAGKFMSRLGVAPQHALGRAIYLHDVEELVMPRLNSDASTTFTTFDDTPIRSCRSTFGEQLLASGPTTAVHLKGSTERLHRTRESLARYRHDLMIALRVINRVEKDVVLAEWEDWVRSEDKNCRKVEGMLREQKKPAKLKGKKAAEGKNAAVLNELGEDFAQYCLSCKTELEAIKNGTNLI